MIENIYGKQKQITCDSCGDGFEVETWEEAQGMMNELGWRKKRVDGEWKHYCPECQEGIK